MFIAIRERKVNGWPLFFPFVVSIINSLSSPYQFTFFSCLSQNCDFNSFFLAFDVCLRLIKECSALLRLKIHSFALRLPRKIFTQLSALNGSGWRLSIDRKIGRKFGRKLISLQENFKFFGDYILRFLLRKNPLKLLSKLDKDNAQQPPNSTSLNWRSLNLHLFS